jgi:hypothetical protein
LDLPRISIRSYGIPVINGVTGIAFLEHKDMLSERHGHAAEKRSPRIVYQSAGSVHGHQISYDAKGGLNLTLGVLNGSLEVSLGSKVLKRRLDFLMPDKSFTCPSVATGLLITYSR